MGIFFHWNLLPWKLLSSGSPKNRRKFPWKDLAARIITMAEIPRPVEGFRGFARFLHTIPQNVSNTYMFPPPPENGRRFPWKNDFAGRMVLLEEVSVEEVSMEGNFHGRKFPKIR